MGNDAPIACLSDLPRPVFDFFYQRFAQVSNPPIDPIRESMVMSLSAWVGPEQNLLAPLSRAHCRRLWLEHPCLLPGDMDAIYGVGGFRGWQVHFWLKLVVLDDSGRSDEPEEPEIPCRIRGIRGHFSLR
jgi:hypothetical protein